MAQKTACCVIAQHCTLILPAVEPKLPGTRKAARTRVRLPARVMKKGVHYGTVMDITTQGFLLVSDAALEAGTFFRVKLEGIDPLRAKVVWVENERAGCEFLPTIHPALLEAAIAASEG